MSVNKGGLDQLLFHFLFKKLIDNMAEGHARLSFPRPVPGPASGFLISHLLAEVDAGVFPHQIHHGASGPRACLNSMVCSP